MVKTLSAAELRSLPSAVDLVTAGRAFGIGRTKAHELARAGEFPTPVLRLGNSYRVTRADLLRALGEGGPGGVDQDLTHRVLGVLDAAGGKGASPAAIATSVEAHRASVQKVLADLADTGRAVRVGHGRWVAIKPATGVRVGVDADGREYVLRANSNDPIDPGGTAA